MPPTSWLPSWGVEPKYYHLADVLYSPWSIWVQELFEADHVLANAGPDEIAFQAFCYEDQHTLLEECLHVDTRISLVEERVPHAGG